MPLWSVFITSTIIMESCDFIHVVIFHTSFPINNRHDKNEEAHCSSGTHLVFGTSSSVGEMGGWEHRSNCSMICSHLWILICVFLRKEPLIGQFSCFPALSSVNFLRVDTLAFLLALIPIYLALRPPQVARVVRPLPAHSLPENIIKFKSLCS